MGGGGNPAPKCRDGAKMDLISFLKENPGPIGHIGEDWYYYDFSGKPQKLLMQKSIELTMCCADCCNGFCNAIDPRFLCLPPVIYDDQDTIGIYDDQDTSVIIQAPNVCRPVDPRVDKTFCKDLIGLPCLKGLMFAPITSAGVQVPAGTEELGGCCMAKFESELPTIGNAQNWFKCCPKGIDSDVQKHLETAWDCCEQFKQYGVFSSDKCYDTVFDDGNNDGLDDDLCEPLQASTDVAAGQDQGAQTSSQPTGAFDRFTNSLGAFVNGTVLVFVLMIGMTILLMRRKPSDRNEEALKELSEKLQSLHHDISSKVDKYDQVIPEEPRTMNGPDQFR